MPHGQARVPALLHRPEPLHRLPGVRAGLQRVRHAPRRVDDPPRVRRPRPRACRRCPSSACTASSRRAPRSARPTRSSAPATAWCSRRASRAASPAATACVACPFGVPELYDDRQIMMKCDMCYDRTSVGKKPMCATVCPSQALFFGTREQIEQLRPAVDARSTSSSSAQQTITTQVLHDGAARAGDAGRRTSTSPRRWTSSREPRRVAEGDRPPRAGTPMPGDDPSRTAGLDARSRPDRRRDAHRSSGPDSPGGRD